MSEEDAITTVRQRGIFMQEEVPAGEGAMAAILALDAAVIEEVTADIDGVWIANYNCPGQIVITGEADAVAEAGTVLKEAGARRVLPLEGERTIPFTDDETCRRRAGKGFCQSQHESSEDPICGEH